MTLTAQNTVGFERSYNKSLVPSNPINMEGSTGTTYTIGRIVGISDGLLSEFSGASSASAAVPIAGVIAETVETTDDEKKVKVHQGHAEVFTVSFDGHTDFTVNGSTADNQVKFVDGTTVPPLVGTMVHIYEGPGKGDTRVVTVSTAASTITTPHTLTISGNFSQRPTTASKGIVTAARPGQFLKVSTVSASKVDGGTAATAGTGQVLVQSVDLANLKADVMIAPNKSIYGMGQTAT